MTTRVCVIFLVVSTLASAEVDPLPLPRPECGAWQGFTILAMLAYVDGLSTEYREMSRENAECLGSNVVFSDPSDLVVESAGGTERWDFRYVASENSYQLDEVIYHNNVSDKYFTISYADNGSIERFKGSPWATPTLWIDLYYSEGAPSRMVAYYTDQSTDDTMMIKRVRWDSSGSIVENDCVEVPCTLVVEE